MSLSVFLCHSSGDKPVVRELYEALQRDGYDPWLDEENILPGQDWNYEISRAVRNSDVVLVCLSEDSVGKAGYVQKEIKFALDVADEQPEGSIFIIPVKLEECEVPDRLNHWHWVNLEDVNGYQRLVEALNRRADDLGIEFDESTDDENVLGSLYDEEETVEAGTHVTYPCELDEGDKINIDLRSDELVDVLIMEESTYEQSQDEGEACREYLDRDQLHAFFTASDSDTYLVIIRNNSDDDDAEIELKISSVD
jgi:hypothetical protein